MVNLTGALLRRIDFVKPSKTPDHFWKKRKILMMAAHFYGRKQRIYSFALVHVRRALRYATFARNRKSKEIKEVQVERIKAACEEHGFTYPYLKESLIRSNILLNTRSLADLAVWEPRTFKSLIDFAWNKAKEEGLNGIDSLGDPPSGVILRPLPVK